MKDWERWLRAAKEDMDAADFNREGGKLSHAAFLYQQAAEKAFKAVLIKDEEGIVQTHDCFVLAKRTEAPERILEKADELTPYYFRTRYPDSGEIDLSEEDLNRLHRAAKEVMEWTKKKL